MNFLNWPIGLAAAALTIPPLIALYFLKLKRREVPIPSTLLWKRAVQDLQVNSPFQRLRNNLLLWLQLLILLLAALALARPIFLAEQKRAKSQIFLIDRSSSMNVVEPDGMTRFEKALEQAALAVDDMGEDDQAMIIAFADRARMVAPFTSDKDALKRLIQGLEPAEGLSQLGEALRLAEAYSQPQIIAGETAGTDVTPGSAEPDAHMILFSDGRIPDADQLVLRRASMEFVQVGGTDDNIGIVALDVRRHYEHPERLNVFARVRNFSDRPLRTDVSLILEGSVADVKEVALSPGRQAAGPATSPASSGQPSSPAAPAGEGVGSPPPGSVGMVSFEGVTFESGGPVEVRIERKDALLADNRAWAIVRPPRHIKILLVTPGNYFLTKAVKVLSIEHEIMTPQDYEKAPDEKTLDGQRSAFDVVIFDDHQTKRLPPGSYFFFGGGPMIDGVACGDKIEGEAIIDWDDSHPILRNVDMESVYVFEWRKLTLPEEAQVIIEGETGPVMGYLARDGRQYLITAFSLLDENRRKPLTQWMLKWHFVPMVSDALQFLSASMSAGGTTTVRPGEALNILVRGGSKTVKVTRPNRQKETIAVRFSDIAHYANTGQFGLYRAEPAVPGSDLFAVNLLDPDESNIAPVSRLEIGADTIASTEGIQKINRPLWPWLLAAGLAILMLEWIVYNRRVFV